MEDGGLGPANGLEDAIRVAGVLTEMGVPGWLWLCVLLVPGAVCGIAGSSCRLMETLVSQTVYKEGDVIIGGVFPIHLKPPEPNLDFTQRSAPSGCQRFILTHYRWLQTMIFAVEEINRNPLLLPNLTLGYAIADTCVTDRTTLGAALGLVTGKDRVVMSSSCGHTPEVPVIVGDARSSGSIVIARTLGVFSIPMVSYSSTCACLGDRQKYPTFFRTVSSDAFQARAMAHMLRLFGWTWVGVIAGDNDYGKSGIQLLLKELQNSEVCVAFSEIIPTVNLETRIPRIVETLRHSTAKVIVTFADASDMEALLMEVVRQNITNKQWIATEGWIISSPLSSPQYLPSLKGTIGFAQRRGNIQGDGPLEKGGCPDVTNLQPWQILHYLRTVNFTTPVGEATHYNENGEPPAAYDLINWHVGAQGTVEFVKVGQFDTVDGSHSEFDMDVKKVLWGGGESEVK
ncbi:hypothetical protein SKAU_G00078310 [Synaphobranchus kaupii]|uniref:Receptor ligand binding region domain-containing protein n=1 Tax=Synaphobranchus kaupii TaxID=118154 RepID=A0A9Q1J5C4_SYNKA|nr:hypothetical protein SKAU_G00078310 [Synaphobranchus kaupii]